MAVSKVTASIDKDSTNLKKDNENLWSGSLSAPRQPENYKVEVVAYDDAGNITAAQKALEVTKWRPPKIDWKPPDRFNYTDYNRIKNNLEHLHGVAVRLYKEFSIQNMGEDYVSYRQYFYADQFNLFEKNLEIINNNVFIQNFGQSQTFYPNGVFIDYEELNRIENAILSIKTIFDNQEAGLKRLPFRLGTFREVRI